MVWVLCTNRDFKDDGVGDDGDLVRVVVWWTGGDGKVGIKGGI